MSDLTNYTPISISELMADIELVKYNPTAMQRVILDNLEAMTNGVINIVDPTNPFTFLLESSTVNTALSINESKLNLRKQYPSLAQTFDDIYLHMSDKDFVNVFATPATSTVTWHININELINNMVDVPGTTYKKVTIPRNTKVTVDKYTFSIQFPIDIIYYNNGVLSVQYDSTITSPLNTLSTNIIPYTVVSDISGVQWLQFTVEVSEFDLNFAVFPLQASALFTQTIPYANQFYYCRAYYQNSNTSDIWTELKTTYTADVFDINTPTVVLKVDITNNELEVFIPLVYTQGKLSSGSIRIDIYTTNGTINVNLSNYNLGSFSTDMFASDQENDISDYTAAFASITNMAYSAETIASGTNGLTFDQLRAQVINNSVGDRNIPITNIQLTSQVKKLGFDILKNVDSITNRIFLATANLPSPTNSNLITPAALTVETLALTDYEMNDYTEIINNGLRKTILSKTLYSLNNGILSIYPQSQVQAIKSQSSVTIAGLVNATKYYYSPFYYVLDETENEFQLRAYDLDSPSNSKINFIKQNATAQAQVNTKNMSISKIENGYRLTIVTSSGNFYKKIPDSMVQLQLRYLPSGENTYAYKNATFVGLNSDGERIYSLDIITNYDIDKSNNMTVTNFTQFGIDTINTSCPLTTIFDIFYTTSSVPTTFIPADTDNLLYKQLLKTNSIAITHEQVTITFGSTLDNLWRQSRSAAIGPYYRTYDSTISAVYEQDIYDIDPTTGSIFNITANEINYTILHHKGDPILDDEGNPTYSSIAGQVILDINGTPVLDETKTTQRLCDLVLVDGKYYFATDSAYVDYRKEIENVLTTWVTDDLNRIDADLLEQTNIYFYPKTASGFVSVMISTGNIVQIDPLQSFTVNLYVPTSVYKDEDIRSKLSSIVISTLNSEIQNSVVSMSDTIDNLKTSLGANVISIGISGLGGSNNYDTVTLVNANEGLAINKILLSQEDNSLIVKEDVVINYVEYQA